MADGLTNLWPGGITDEQTCARTDGQPNTLYRWTNKQTNTDRETDSQTDEGCTDGPTKGGRTDGQIRAKRVGQ